MTDALQGTAPRKPTLTEQANAPRIGRARFIGNLVGAVLIVAAIEVAVTFAGFKQILTIEDKPVPLPNHWALLVGSVVIFLVAIDLVVRRRYDRGQTGTDCVAILVLLEAMAISGLFGLLTSVPPMVLVAVAGLAVLYLLVTLVILGGTKGPNAYGPPPLKD